MSPGLPAFNGAPPNGYYLTAVWIRNGIHERVQHPEKYLGRAWNQRLSLEEANGLMAWLVGIYRDEYEIFDALIKLDHESERMEYTQNEEEATGYEVCLHIEPGLLLSFGYQRHPTPEQIEV